MSLLSKLKLITSGAKAEKVFIDLTPGYTFFDIQYKKPSEYVEIYWSAFEKYQKAHKQNNALNGKIFELIINTLFIREGLLPMYLQARAAFIPDINYDIILYNKEIGPINISLKTSLRERKKQADLEAVALKYVHRKAKCYLISLNEQEVKAAKESQQEGALLGLDKIIYALSKEFDEFITYLKKIPFSEAGEVSVIETNLKVTQKSVDTYGNKRK